LTPPDFDPRALADELDDALVRHVLEPRFPAAIDHHGFGFWSKYDARWRVQPETRRPFVYHARLVWTAGFLSCERPALVPRLADVARHGLAGLLGRFWDPDGGGFFHSLLVSGEPDPKLPMKALYSQAFGVFALARLSLAGALEIDHDAARRAALTAFDWIEEHYRLPGRPGYLSAVELDGTPLPFDRESVAPRIDLLGGPAGWHDQNSHLHLLEAYTELWRATREPRVAERALDLIDLLLGSFYAEPGCLHLLLDADGRPVPGPISFGHDIEATFLLFDAAEELDRRDWPRLERIALRLAEHAVRFGWDPHVGVWTERGRALGRSEDLTCGWWVATEALNTASLLAARPGCDVDGRWRDVMIDTWNFLTRRLIDHEHGGFWIGYNPRGLLYRIKGEEWFATYHSSRALVLVADRLRAGAG